VTWHENVELIELRPHSGSWRIPNQLVSPTRAISSRPTHWWEAARRSRTRRSAKCSWSPRAGVLRRSGSRALGTTARRSGRSSSRSARRGSATPASCGIPYTNEFGIVFTGFVLLAARRLVCQRCRQAACCEQHCSTSPGGTYIADVAFNTVTNRYLAVWWQSGTQGAEIDAAGDVLTVRPAIDGHRNLRWPRRRLQPAKRHIPHRWPGSERQGLGSRTEQPRRPYVERMRLSRAAELRRRFVLSSRRRPRTPLRRSGTLPFHNSHQLRDQIVSTTSNGGGNNGATLGSVSARRRRPHRMVAEDRRAVARGWHHSLGAVCVNGGWIPGSGGGDSGGGGSTGGCPGSAPFPGAVCVNGGWIPGTGGGDSGGGGSTGGCPGLRAVPRRRLRQRRLGPRHGRQRLRLGGSTGGCPGSAPFPGAVCVNGGWVPGTGGSVLRRRLDGRLPGLGAVPRRRLRQRRLGTRHGRLGTPALTGGCPGVAPFPGAVCVNGGWVPGTGGSGSGGSTGSCPGSAPFPGAVCVNGGWVPGSGDSSGAACPGSAPFPGAVCVNGGWVPGSDSSSCSTPDPFAAIGGGICTNGGWTPKGA
jgi:hypothetical protein